MGVILTGKNIRKSYGDKVILNNVSISLNENKLHVLLGKNGCGKTTLMRLLSGIDFCCVGNILFESENITNIKRDKYARLVSYLSHHHKMVFNYSVLDFVLLGAIVHATMLSKPRKKDIEIAKEIICQMNMEKFINANICDLSSGERQMILLCRAIVQDSKVLLLDEPISNLDLDNQNKVMESIKKLISERNKTVLVTLHDPNIAIDYCDELFFLNKGVISEALKKTEDNFLEKFKKQFENVYSSKYVLIDDGEYAFIKKEKSVY